MTAVVITRRGFLAALGLSAGGLALGVRPRRAAAAAEGGFSPNPFVHVAPDGLVTIVCHRSEMGQGVRSSVPVLIADELGADMARVKVVQAVGDKKYGDQNTDGSSSVRKQYDDLRRVGATARAMLIAAAAKQWKVKPETCAAKDHAVTHAASKRSLGFGALAEAAAKLPVPKDVRFRPESELARVKSAALPLLDGKEIVTGTATFGGDVKLPGMLIAVIARPPVVGGKVARHDPARALAVQGVKKVVLLPDPKPPYAFQPWGGVAVIAENTWAALEGRAALEITWEHGDNASYDSAVYKDALLAAVRAPGKVLRNTGDVEAALASAKRVVEAEYHVPHLAHLAMEPPAAIARFADGRCEVWAPTQHPINAKTEAARVLGVAEDAVTVNVTLLGGGFGRKSKADFVSEAAFLSKEAGAPVRVQWTRDDDVRHGYYNAVNAQRLRAGLDDAGKLVAWHHRTAYPPIASTFDGKSDTPAIGDLQQGVLDVAIDAPHVRAEGCGPNKAHVRIGWYRSVYNIFHAFAVGSFIDEIAHARGADPRDVLLEVIGPPRVLGLGDLGVAELRNYGESLERHPVDAGRLRRVIERVTESARWSARAKEGRTLGLAAHRSFVTYAAVVLSVVEDERRKVRVDEAWIAMDPGKVINQERVLAQMQGAVVMGISNAMFGGITVKDGAVVESNFRDARIARIGDTPRQIHVDLVPSDAPPGGVGEPGVPPVGAALANAVFALTGQRIRELPIARALGV